MLPTVQTEPVPFNCGAHSVNAAATPPATLPPSLTPESDVDDFVDIFFGVDITGVSTYPRIESCDLQLGDTWRGMQGKMSVTAPEKKIRKKSDHKPLSQINKCHNEKKRRELENETINQLEELLGTCLAEVKQPDKNGIVREATRQIQEVLKRRRECPGECPLRVVQCLSPVQAGEVSSTQSQPSGLHYSEITTLIEALKHYTGSLGWILLEINDKAEIECVTENIKDLILRDRTELYKKSIFSLVHVKDHAKLRPLLRCIQTYNWSTGESDKFQAIQASLIVETDGTDSTSVVEAVIHASPVRGSSEEAGSVMCVIRRCEDASAALIPVGGGPPAITAKPQDQIVFRLNCNFSVLSCDLSGVENFSNYSVSLVGTPYLELVESGDRARIASHLAEAACLPAPPAISEPFWLRVIGDRPPLRVSARSRLFRAKPSSGEPDFIMSTHTVLGDDEEAPVLDTGSRTPPLGGPLLPSAANGEPASREQRYRPPLSPAGVGANADPHFSIGDFDLDPWTSSLLGDMAPEEPKEVKPEQERGGGTPRPPSTPAATPPPPPHHHEEPNRLRKALLSKKQEPNNRILIDLLQQEDEEGTGSESSAPHTPHTPHTPAAALSPLHTPAVHARPSPHLHHAHASHHQHAHHQPQTSQHSHMSPASHSQQQGHTNLLSKVRMLSEKTDDDAEDNRRNSNENRGVSQTSVLSQLLSNSNGPNNGRSQANDNDGYLERISGMKRKFEEAKGMTLNLKRATPENQQQVSSSAASAASSPASSTATSPATSSSPGMSSLCQKNQILVSLLAKQQTTPTTPLPLPNPNLRALPPRPRAPPPAMHAQVPQHPQHPPPQRMHHSTLSTILSNNNHRPMNVNGGTSGNELQHSHLQMVLQQGSLQGARYPPPPPHYANAASQHYPHASASVASGTRQVTVGGGELPSDQMLSDLLDDVVNSMPDSDATANLRGTNQKDIVNAIRQSLMQCESVNPTVTSPSTPPVYSVQSPVRGSMTMSPGQSGMYTSRAASAAAGIVAEQQRRLMQMQRSQQMLGSSEVASTKPATHPNGSDDLQQRARLLQMQRSQQMLVSPEAAEQPQPDLGSTINALVSETPPNVTLTRGDYHHNLYQTNQMGSNYGTIKITSTQQNPMLSRQLSVGGSSGYSGVATHSAAALHTPMTPQPYHRPPRPHLVGGYYEDGAGQSAYCGEYARCTPHATHPPHPPHPPQPPHPPHPPHDHQMQCTGNGSPAVGVGVGSGNSGGTSEYVRNELRAVVGARSARPDLHPLQPPDMDNLMSFDMPAPGGGSVVGGRAPSAAPSSWESQQSTASTTVAVSAEGLPAGGDATQTGAGGAAGAGSAGPTTASKASLLQKLLSQ